MTDHAEKATELAEQALEKGASLPAVLLGAAGVHAALAIADAIRHGLRDIIYELRD